MPTKCCFHYVGVKIPTEPVPHLPPESPCRSSSIGCQACKAPLPSCRREVLSPNVRSIEVAMLFNRSDDSRQLHDESFEATLTKLSFLNREPAKGSFRFLQDEATEVHIVQTAFGNQFCIQGKSSWRH